MPSGHRILAEWTPERFLQWAATIGAELTQVISAVIESREVPEQAFKSCLGILNLEKKFGKQRLESASKRANRYQLASYKALKNILDRGLDQKQEPDEQQPQAVATVHPNIRGAGYYAKTGAAHE